MKQSCGRPLGRSEAPLLRERVSPPLHRANVPQQQTKKRLRLGPACDHEGDRTREGWRTTPVSRLPSTPLHPIPHNGGKGMGGGIGTFGVSQSQPSSRRLRRMGNEGCVVARSGLSMTVAVAATTANGKQTRRPGVKERDGRAGEMDRPMKHFSWGGEEGGLNRASARPTPRNNFIISSRLTTNSPQTIPMT